MQLTKLKVEKFKRVNDLVLDLADVNVLVGGNGSGKSSVLQAVHLACCVMRQADSVRSNGTATVGIEELDYLPTNDYKTLGHNANWGNTNTSPSSKVTLTFNSDPDDPETPPVEAECTLRSARNAGISVTGQIPSDLTPILRARKKFFSAYIPGISGVPNREERKSKKVILKSCSYGDSNVILRNALLLLKDDDPAWIETIERWIEPVLGPVSISVSHDDDNDLQIRCDITTNGVTKAIELAGAGFLQLIQVFCYVLLFKPGVLLIDEPDIHLHPDVQERLVAALGEVARERKLRVILSTHSPFIVRGAPPGTNVYWLQDGNTLSKDREAAELALGWGAFGKQAILVSEDAKPDFLRHLLKQWPELDQKIAFYPGTGYANLPSPEQAQELSKTLGDKYKIIVHRDRDSLTDDEAATLEAKYAALGVHLWLTAQSDVEAYFCEPSFLEVFLGCTNAQAQAHLNGIFVAQAVPIQDQFAAHRAAHNEELHAAGGSPTNANVWTSFQTRTLKGAKGKFVFKQLKNAIGNTKFNEAKIKAFQLGGTVAMDLKHRLESILRA